MWRGCVMKNRTTSDNSFLSKCKEKSNKLEKHFKPKALDNTNTNLLFLTILTYLEIVYPAQILFESPSKLTHFKPTIDQE